MTAFFCMQLPWICGKVTYSKRGQATSCINTAVLLSHLLFAEAIDSKISNLKRGKAEVIESNHVLVLGWSSKIVKLLQELCLAERYQVTALLSWNYEH